MNMILIKVLLVLYSFSVVQNSRFFNKFVENTLIQDEPQEGIEHFEPVIGIFAQPSEDIEDHYKAEEGYSYIPVSYVRWIESAGGRVVPIPYNLNDTTLNFLLKRINGVLIPGGDASLWVNEQTHTGFANQTITGEKILKKVLQFNQRGKQQNLIGQFNLYTLFSDQFPLWATCMGYEMIAMIVTQDDKVLDNFNSTNHSLNTKINYNNMQDNMIYKNIPEYLYQTIETGKAFYYNHRYGLEIDHFYKTSSLSSNFDLTSTSESNGKSFVATLEGKGDYKNIFLSQYHPEKNAFEWKPSINANHSPESVSVSQYEANMFVNQARKNKQRFDSFEQFTQYSILNYQPINSLLWDNNHQVAEYVFRASNNGDVDPIVIEI